MSRRVSRSRPTAGSPPSDMTSASRVPAGYGAQSRRRRRRLRVHNCRSSPTALRQEALTKRACIGSLPSFRELIAVEQPEDTPDHEQDEFVKRTWNRQKPQRAAPPQRPGNTPIANDNLDGADRPDDERSGGSHSASQAAWPSASRSPTRSSLYTLSRQLTVERRKGG
jgi:hypothetical protein